MPAMGKSRRDLSLGGSSAGARKVALVCLLRKLLLLRPHLGYDDPFGVRITSEDIARDLSHPGKVQPAPAGLDIVHAHGFLVGWFEDVDAYRTFFTVAAFSHLLEK